MSRRRGTFVGSGGYTFVKGVTMAKKKSASKAKASSRSKKNAQREAEEQEKTQQLKQDNHTLTPADANTNPVMLDAPTKAPGQLNLADNDTNPAMLSPLGGPVAPRQAGEVQTTIDTDTTTINRNTSIINPVEPTGEEAPLKRATVGKGVRAEAKATNTKSNTKAPNSKVSSGKRGGNTGANSKTN
jgi:hypothetical protein